MRIAVLAMSLLFAVPVATARDCDDAPDKALLYLALDTMLEYPRDTLDEAAIENYRHVIDNGVKDRDEQAVELSCALLTRMLLAAGDLESRPHTYAGCPGDPAAQATAARMVETPADATGISSDYLPIVRISPEYPVQTNSNAVVVVHFTVSPDGDVTSERVVASSDERFDHSALQAVRKNRYKPRIENGVAVEAPGVLLTISYRLSGDDSRFTRETSCEQ